MVSSERPRKVNRTKMRALAQNAFCRSTRSVDPWKIQSRNSVGLCQIVLTNPRSITSIGSVIGIAIRRLFCHTRRSRNCFQALIKLSGRTESAMRARPFRLEIRDPRRQACAYSVKPVILAFAESKRRRSENGVGKENP